MNLKILIKVYTISITILFIPFIQPAPPMTIPHELFNEFTLNGKIPAIIWYFNDTYSSLKPHIYTQYMVNNIIHLALQQKPFHYGITDTFLYSALSKYNASISEKSIGILGSVTPVYEGITIANGGHPTIIEYNKIISQDPRVKAMTVAEYDQNPILFDTLISISSFEHDGLGRFGDPIDPNGDLKAMEKCKKMLKSGGILFLAVPIGLDCLTWNAHRIYGKIRLPLLLDGWKILDFFGYEPTIEAGLLHSKTIGEWHYQPIIVLTPNDNIA